MQPLRFDPWVWLASLPDVKIRSVQMPADEMGGWVADDRSILLDQGLSEVEERCTGVHEGVHALRNDRPLKGIGPDGDRLDRRQERDVDRIAARLLLGADTARVAEVVARTHNLAEAAWEIGVEEPMLWTFLHECLTDDEKRGLQDRADKIEEQTWPLT